MTWEGKFRRQNLKIFFVLGSLQFFLVAFLGYVREGCVRYAFMAIGKLMLYLSYLVDLLCCFRCELMQGLVRTPLMVLCALPVGWNVLVKYYESLQAEEALQQQVVLTS